MALWCQLWRFVAKNEAFSPVLLAFRAVSCIMEASESLREVSNVSSDRALQLFGYPAGQSAFVRYHRTPDKAEAPLGACMGVGAFVMMVQA